jgi:lathosterol oxidase
MIDICTIGGNFPATWAVLSFLGFLSIASSSAVVFKLYFIDITFEKWQTKINPEYPTAKKVRDEIVLMLKGLCFSALCPALSLYLSSQGLSQAYCTFSEGNEYGLPYHIFQFAVITLVSDFYEWGYHRLGHIYKPFWEVHRHHHIFYNPSPFSVISDEYTDQFARALPLVIFPLVMKINMELMFFIYSVFFYVYGVYLHFGHEFDWLDAHHPVLNTSYQHYIHHAKSIYNKPYHTGFFFKIWDQMAGSLYPDAKCDCIKCQKEKNGERTKEQYDKIVKPDYSVLWKDPTIWWGSVKYDNPHAKSAATPH